MAKRKSAKKRTVTKSSGGVWGIQYSSFTFLLFVVFVLVVVLFLFYRVLWLRMY